MQTNTTTNTTIYDLAIVGGGPAGCAGAVYAARKRLKTVFLTSEWGGQSVVSEGIENWIGTPVISGADLAKSLREHVEKYDGDYLHIVSPTWVKTISKTDGGFQIEHSKGEIITAKSILIATGSGRRKLEAKGADIFEHKGLTYCASCDGPLFADQPVAVLGGGNAAFESAAQLLAYCSHVYLIHRSNDFRADQITIDKLKTNPKLTIITNADVTEITGDKFVEGLSYLDKTTNEQKELTVSGVFVEIGQIPNTDIVKGLVDIDSHGKIVIDPWTGMSSVAGIWGAGDCTNIRYHQNNIATGEAVKALEDIYQWLHKQ
ncbi:MAG: FAD-dependent oxidoreductase [bacterium]